MHHNKVTHINSAFNIIYLRCALRERNYIFPAIKDGDESHDNAEVGMLGVVVLIKIMAAEEGSGFEVQSSPYSGCLNIHYSAVYTSYLHAPPANIDSSRNHEPR